MAVLAVCCAEHYAVFVYTQIAHWLAQTWTLVSQPQSFGWPGLSAGPTSWRSISSFDNFLHSLCPSCCPTPFVISPLLIRNFQKLSSPYIFYIQKVTEYKNLGIVIIGLDPCFKLDHPCYTIPLKSLSDLLLRISKDSNSTTPLGRLSQCLTTLTVGNTS